MHVSTKYRRGLSALLIAVAACWCGALQAPVEAAEAGQGSPPAPASPRLHVVSPEPPLEPGHDVERGPIGQGEQFRLWTPVTEAEVNAVDPSFRQWVHLIRTGQADKRIMRLYAFYRPRLDPFDVPIPESWRERGAAVLRDEARTRAALDAFAARRAASSPTGQDGALDPARRGEFPHPPPGSLAATDRALRGESPESARSTMGISPYGVWVPIGPYNIPGRMTGIDRPEGELNTLYASAADGGAWRTLDGGATWTTLTDLEATQSAGAILLDPTNPDVIYLGTGEGNGAIDNYGGIGVLKSSDSGKTWARSNAFSGSIRRLAMHSSEPSRIYAAGDSGCYRSIDGGATFDVISGAGLPTGAGASDVLVRPDNPDWVYCAIWGGGNGGIYRSTDHGASWSLLSAGLPAQGTVGRIALAVSKSSPDVMIAGIDTSGGTVYKTTNGGTSWTALAGGSAGFCGGQCWYDLAVGIDAGDPNVLYAAGIGNRRSIDGGVNWGAADAGVHVDHHFVFTPTPGEVFLANDGGLYRSGDQGASWSSWSLGMDTSQYYGICRHPSDPAWAFGGTQDNGSHRRRLADAPQWQQVLGGDGGMCMHGPETGSVIVGEYQNLSIQRSADGGASFAWATGGIPSNEPHPWVGVLVVDPVNRNNMWTGTSRVYRSLDARATNWIGVSGPLYFGLSVSALEVAPTSSSTVYAGYDAGGLYVSANALAGSVTWTNIRGGAHPQRGVRRIRAHPTIVDTVYVVFGGYGGGKVWKSADRGGAWSDRTGDFPDVPINDLVIDPDNPGTLVASTDLGIFRTDDDGANWYGWSTGFPTVASIELTYDSTAGKLRVGTHGRSMWDWQEASETPTAVPDGAAVPGVGMTADRIGASAMRLRWDVRSCTARDYNLFYGDLDDVGSLAYAGAVCGLGSSGTATVPLPDTASGNAFFLLASSDGAGNEGPHDVDLDGNPKPAHGIGLCGITAQVSAATCP